jgi:hypothetical protein
MPSSEVKNSKQNIFLQHYEVDFEKMRSSIQKPKLNKEQSSKFPFLIYLYFIKLKLKDSSRKKMNY